jgi:hypothetical protein
MSFFNHTVIINALAISQTLLNYWPGTNCLSSWVELNVERRVGVSTNRLADRQDVHATNIANNLTR